MEYVVQYSHFIQTQSMVKLTQKHSLNVRNLLCKIIAVLSRKSDMAKTNLLIGIYFKDISL